VCFFILRGNLHFEIVNDVIGRLGQARFCEVGPFPNMTVQLGMPWKAVDVHDHLVPHRAYELPTREVLDVISETKGLLAASRVHFLSSTGLFPRAFHATDGKTVVSNRFRGDAFWKASNVVDRVEDGDLVVAVWPSDDDIMWLLHATERACGILLIGERVGVGRCITNSAFYKAMEAKEWIPVRRTLAPSLSSLDFCASAELDEMRPIRAQRSVQELLALRTAAVPRHEAADFGMFSGECDALSVVHRCRALGPVLALFPNNFLFWQNALKKATSKRILRLLYSEVVCQGVLKAFAVWNGMQRVAYSDMPRALQTYKLHLADDRYERHIPFRNALAAELNLVYNEHRSLFRRVCHACLDKPGTKRCSACGKVFYCGGACQARHWHAYHGSVCCK
jgi:hypothetical protein